MSSTVSHNIHPQATRALPQESELQVTPFPHAFAEALEAPDINALSQPRQPAQQPEQVQ